VNKSTGVSEQKLSRFDHSGREVLKKINLIASNNNVYGTCVNTEIRVGERFCNGVTNFTQGGHILDILNLLSGFIIANIAVVIFLCMKISQKKRYLCNITIKFCKCNYT
jgi:hypothetical protein